jgi:site-specific DNA-methyltransferase (adenine-specific)
MKEINDGKQMKDVWNLPAIGSWEKSCGKHPTQKPLCVLARIILASTRPNAWVFDPFTGSSTTGIAASLLNRRFLGIDKELEYMELSKCRRLEIDNSETFERYKQKIQGFKDMKSLGNYVVSEPMVEYGMELPF